MAGVVQSMVDARAAGVMFTRSPTSGDRSVVTIEGSWGLGSGGHLAMEALNLQAGTTLQHVPYKGVAPLLQDLIGGNIKVAVVDIAAGTPHVRSGKLRPIAVSGPKRASLLR